MEKPLVSVIIPAYNCARWLNGAVDSALKQEVPLEILVINDCSKESLEEVLEQYKNDPRVRYIRNEKNLLQKKLRQNLLRKQQRLKNLKKLLLEKQKKNKQKNQMLK